MSRFLSINSVAVLRSSVAVLATCVVLLAGNAAYAGEDALPYYDSPEFTPRWLDAGSAELSSFHRIPGFNFTNQQGRQITDADVAGKIYVASFFFSTCPGICPAIRSKLTKVQERFLDDDTVTILSHSIRPATDTVEILQAYASDHGVQNGKWHLLTGDRDSIYRLAREAYFADEDLGDAKTIEDFLHTENLVLIDRNRHIRGVYNGLSSSSVKNLINDIEMLRSAASVETTGS